MLTCTWNRLMVMKLACRHIRMHFYYETTNKFGPINFDPARLWVLDQNETESHHSVWRNESCTHMFVLMNRSCAHDLCLCTWLHVCVYDACEYIICGYAHDLLLCSWPMVVHMTCCCWFINSACPASPPPLVSLYSRKSPNCVVVSHKNAMQFKLSLWWSRWMILEATYVHGTSLSHGWLGVCLCL